MMGPLWNARFVAKVLGIPAVMLGSIFAFPWLVAVVVSGSIPDWLRALVIMLYALLILAAAGWRLCRGGEQGPTDIVIQETATARTITISNVHLVGGPTGKALETFAQMPPVPRPIGIVRGSPAAQADLIVDARAALPDRVPVAEQPLEAPERAHGLESNAGQREPDGG